MLIINVIIIIAIIIIIIIITITITIIIIIIHFYSLFSPWSKNPLQIKIIIHNVIKKY